MDLHRLRCFMKVVDDGTITKAAKSLNMTQPPLSILIQKFEDELDVKLFYREGNKLKLTPSGEFLYNRGKELFQITKNTKEQMLQLQNGATGTVKIGCSTSASLFIIPDIIQKLQIETPNIIPNISEGSTTLILNELKNFKIDIGIVRSIVEDKKFSTHMVLEEPILVALPPNHPLCNKSEITITDLQNDSFLLPRTTHGNGLADIVIKECEENGFSPDVGYWGIEVLPILFLVNKGAGISFVPNCFDLLNSPELPVIRSISGSPKLKTSLSVVTLKKNNISPVSERFLKTSNSIIDETNLFTKKLIINS